MVVDRKSVEELRNRGVVKLRDKDMYALWVKTACGNMSAKQLRQLAARLRAARREPFRPDRHQELAVVCRPSIVLAV